MSTKEQRLLDYVRGHSKTSHPLSVLEAFDKFSADVEWTMHVGDTKGVVLDQAIRDLQPKVCLELGTYCGYSAIRMARQLRTGGRVICVEPCQEYAEIARGTVRHAGLDKKVKVIVGCSSQVIPQLKSKHGVPKVDFVFLDHVESLYTSDLKLLERHELLSTGSVILADNVLHPGAPDFLKYVRGSPRYECTFHPASVRVEGNTVHDGLMKAVYYHRRI
ncbi:COMT [Branchiostoma lanceolatum]|uniref:catechol O-methyltransferase n=1 Tax=Branchiostoma lanceolatum TaxID=7740 RepID=A0A8K0EZH5_BRALA|nr:COMT [Branchiostoma lanceolatum]